MKTLLTLIFIFFLTDALAQMSGTYTIDKSATSTSSNFTSLTSAIDLLVSEGMSGDVEINVVPGSGPYTEQVTVPRLSGSSSHTLRINGNNEEFNLNNRTSLGDYLVAFDSAQNCLLRDFTIRLLNYKETSIGVIIKNSSSNITIENNDIYCMQGPDYNYYPSSGILIADDAYIDSNRSEWYNVLDYRPIKGNSRGITIKKNYVKNASFGILADYLPAHTGTNFIENNVIVDFIYKGIYVGGGNDIIKGNDISRPTIDGGVIQFEDIYGIRASGGDTSGKIQIIDNYIHDVKGKAENQSTTSRCGILCDGGQAKGVFSFFISSRNFNALIKQNIVNLDDVNYGSMIVTSAIGNVEITDNHLLLRSSNIDEDSEYFSGIEANNRYGVLNNNGHLNISRNTIDIKYETVYTGQYARRRASVKGISTSSLNSTTTITNNIISLSSVFTSTIDVSDPLYREQLLGLTGITCRGRFDATNTIANNTIVVKKNLDMEDNTVAFCIEKGKHSIMNNLVSFVNLSKKGTLIETNDSTTWTASHNAVHFNDSLIFSHKYGTINSTDNLIDFNSISGGQNIVENPLFINSTVGDYTPTNNKILNGGTPIPSVLVDHFGTERSSSSPDIGAIEVTNNDNQLIAYPNPASSVIRVAYASETASLDLYNTLGALVLSGSGCCLDISGVSSGMYIFKITEDDQSTTRRVIIE